MDDIFSSHLIGQVSKSSPTPLYHQLYSLLKARILDGTLALGLRLPPEEQLADLFKVSRITAKRAMDDLATEELGRATAWSRDPCDLPVLSKAGAGTFDWNAAGDREYGAQLFGADSRLRYAGAAPGDP
jgi:DNA-binding transcriptional MocR family regulator